MLSLEYKTFKRLQYRVVSSPYLGSLKVKLCLYAMKFGQCCMRQIHNMNKWCTRFWIYMDSLKIQGFTKSWFPKVFWDFLIFLHNVTNIRSKMKYSNKDSIDSARFSHIVYEIQASLRTPWLHATPLSTAFRVLWQD